MSTAPAPLILFAPDFPLPVQALLRLLHGAFCCAQNLGRPPPDFALDLATVLRTGIDEDQLRSLIQAGIVERHQEMDRRGRAGRSCRPGAAPVSDPQSLFILSAAGAALLT